MCTVLYLNPPPLSLSSSFLLLLLLLLFYFLFLGAWRQTPAFWTDDGACVLCAVGKYSAGNSKENVCKEKST
jgi:hypothetical protein